MEPRILLFTALFLALQGTRAVLYAFKYQWLELRHWDRLHIVLFAGTVAAAWLVLKPDPRTVG